MTRRSNSNSSRCRLEADAVFVAGTLISRKTRSKTPYLVPESKNGGESGKSQLPNKRVSTTSKP
ncbi:hypothetical protein RHMOL_Rhmol07G0147400 [Rhododendron molle]|uniref:Uncharacterized protein n=1 Tax=Rhododendron molle TaxID=49168 RepID=A0ACC0N0G1_RHOML|nr:hypothetical protein RHMOL_Rhmol07G0147400 [Rhododendron molle]